MPESGTDHVFVKNARAKTWSVPVLRLIDFLKVVRPAWAPAGILAATALLAWWVSLPEELAGLRKWGPYALLGTGLLLAWWFNRGRAFVLVASLLGAVAAYDLYQTRAVYAAITVLVDLLGADPYDLDALVLLARTLVQDGRPDRGLEATERVLRFAEGHSGALFVRGEAFAALRRLEDATNAWEALVRGEPTSAWAAEARSRLRSARDLLHILSGTGP